MVRVLGEIKDTPVMVDAEYPLTKNPSLIFVQPANFFRNRALIRRFVSGHGNVYVAEYYPTGRFKEAVMSFLGLHFDLNKFNSRVIKMVYHSMHRFDRGFITQKLKEGKQEFGSRFIVGYGTIAKGINGDEPLLSEKQLREDLSVAKAVGIGEVIIFRLGGMNKGYANVIKKFS